MKKLVLSMAGVMLLAFIAMTVMYYQNTRQLAYPPFWQLLDRADGGDTKDKPVQPDPEPLYMVNTADTISYSLQNDALHITYDKGKNWIKVPVEKDLLFEGEYNGNKQELIDHSYILTKDRAAFLYSEGEGWKDKKVLLTYTLDRGKTWKDAVVTEHYPAMRFRKVGFVNDDFGYAILTGDRTMSQEAVSVFITKDGGENWQEAANPGVTWLVSDGGFVSESTGFLSITTSNPEEPTLYVTQDGAKTWNKAAVHIPEKYHRIFVTAEVPVKEGNHLAVLINQGPNGDYQGGEVKGKFISHDNGAAWEFVKEVQPDEME